MRHRLPVSDDPPAERGGRHALDPAAESPSHPLSLDSATLPLVPRPAAAETVRILAVYPENAATVKLTARPSRVDAATTRLREVAARTRLVPPTTRLPQVRPAAIPGPRTAPPADLAVYRTPLPRRARTLLDVLEETAARHPDAPALDAGAPLTYRTLLAQVGRVAAMLQTCGVRAGDRVGVRMSSGTADLYLGILGVLAAGAAYVPVDADDPAERAETIWAEAHVCGVLGDGVRFTPRGRPASRPLRSPTPADDAWIIFTSGSTGKP